MRTKFTSHGNDACSVRYQDGLTDLIENRTFAKHGHYVFEIGFNGYERQVCKGLVHDGITLMCNESVDLIDVIRKEYKSFKYQQTKFLRG